MFFKNEISNHRKKYPSKTFQTTKIEQKCAPISSRMQYVLYQERVNFYVRRQWMTIK